MKILITGAGGLLGRHLASELSTYHSTILYQHSQLDITHTDQVYEVIISHRPEIVINCAAMTGVDACELDSKTAFLKNAEGPRILAEACSATHAWLIHISTDYVFDGLKTGPYEPDDLPSPISVYGASKLLGEQYVRQVLEEHCILRVAGLYGTGGRNFASSLPTLLTKPGMVSAVADNRMLTSYAPDVAAQVRQFAEGQHTGTYHVTNSGEPCSWYEFALAGAKLLGPKAQAELVPVNENDLNRPAARPANSTLACSPCIRLGFLPLRDWHVALAEFLV